MNCGNMSPPKGPRTIPSFYLSLKTKNVNLDLPDLIIFQENLKREFFLTLPPFKVDN